MRDRLSVYVVLCCTCLEVDYDIIGSERFDIGVKELLKNFLPNEYKKSVFDIRAEDLLARGIKSIITDLDNTLVEWDRKDATPEICQWFEEMTNAGLDVLIVSNNNEGRVKIFCEPLGVRYVHDAKKPLKKAFQTALHVLKRERDEVVMIGDQLMTDILGANRAKIYSILVVPVASSDAFVTKFNRMIERKIMASLKKRGYITWEE